MTVSLGQNTFTHFLESNGQNEIKIFIFRDL